MSLNAKDKRNYSVFTGPELAFYLLCNLELFIPVFSSRCLRACKRENKAKGEDWKVCSAVGNFQRKFSFLIESRASRFSCHVRDHLLMTSKGFVCDVEASGFRLWVRSPLLALKSPQRKIILLTMLLMVRASEQFRVKQLNVRVALAVEQKINLKFSP